MVYSNIAQKYTLSKYKNDTTNLYFTSKIRFYTS